MSDKDAPSETVVSRFLGTRFLRSRRQGEVISAGFTVRRALGYGLRETDWVVVEHEASSRDQWTLTEEALLEKEQKALVVYEEFLKGRYDVARNDEDGPDEWNCLLVRNKTEREES